MITSFNSRGPNGLFPIILELPASIVENGNLIIIPEEQTVGGRIDLFNCEYCSYGTSRRRKIKAHIKTFHHLGGKFHYNSMGLSTKDIKKWKAREYERMRRTENILKEKFPCKQCDFLGGTKAVLNNHVLAKHLKEKPHSCPYCEYKAVELVNMKRHIKARHTNVKSASCPFCDYMGLHSGNLKLHIRTKHTDDKMECLYCDYRTAMNIEMKRHVTRVHLKILPFQCSHCEKQFSRSTHLKRHVMMKHTMERPLPCPHCDLRFVQKSDLRNHVLRHNKGNKLGVKKSKKN